MGADEEAYSSSIAHAHLKKAANSLNTPPIGTPPRGRTPPPATKRASERSMAVEGGAQSGRGSSSLKNDAIDPTQLSKALLREFEDAGRQRDVTPGGSPSRKRQRVYGDR